MKAIASSGKIRSKKRPAFNVQAFLDSAGVAKRIVEYRRSEKIYSQGESAMNVLYIQKGGIKLSVVNEVGKEAVVAMLGPGDFFGEGGMAGQLVRMGTATAITPVILLVIE
jgi:CRP-like cAMP-binding protein